MVLAAAKAGRGSKKLHSLVTLLKFHTRTRLSTSISGLKPTTGSTTGGGVGVGVGVGVGEIKDVETVKEVKDKRLLATATTTWWPVGRSGTKTLLVKVPSLSVVGPGKGMTGIFPMVREETGTKAG